MTTVNDKSYGSYYQNQDLIKVYPTEFVIRSFLGNYPNLHIGKASLAGNKVLDLGFGDGRNMVFLADLGMQVHGVEVTSDICDHIVDKMLKNGVIIEAKQGRNNSIPYTDHYFDNVLACNSCYYIDEGTTFSDNLMEISRVLKPGGLFIFSLPMGTTFIMDEAIDQGAGYMQITQDPYGVRVGAVLKKFDSKEEIMTALNPLFEDIRIGSCKDDYWGSLVHLWFVVCKRRD